jgi:hypothetical protein
MGDRCKSYFSPTRHGGLLDRRAVTASYRPGASVGFQYVVDKALSGNAV